MKVPDTDLLEKHPSYLTLKKLYIEPTTSCNFHCEMCVKQSADQNIQEGNMSSETFNQLIPAMSSLSDIVFSGIGEPLLHPQLPQFVKTARANLPHLSTIGIQSNGSLLTPELFNTLVENGLNRLCLSVDTIDPATFKNIRVGGEFDQMNQTLQMIRVSDQKISLGVEFVIMQKNLNHLPDLMQWAVNKQVDFVIVTQMLPYDKSSGDEISYGTNTDISRKFFQNSIQTIQEQHPHLKPYLNFDRFLSYRWNYQKTAEEAACVDLIESVKDKAFAKGIPFHINRLFGENNRFLSEIEDVFTLSKSIADKGRIELNLPSISPMFDRKCNFIEDGSAFVSWFGTIHPCYFLWHQYACFINGHKKQVQERSFGDINEQNLDTIWHSSEFRMFRKTVLQYEYPYCNDCKVGPCDLITDDSFESDCYTINVPCGHCPWGSGLLQCLQ